MYETAGDAGGGAERCAACWHWLLSVPQVDISTCKQAGWGRSCGCGVWVLSCPATGGGWLRCVLSQMHAVRVRMSGSFALQLPHVPCLCIRGHQYPTAHARGHPCCRLGRVDERNSARQRPAPGMEETWPAGAYYVCTKMSLRFLTLVRVCLC